MATKKKMLQAAAGNATGGAGLDITDVFSTYLYTGNGSTQTITNDIDLDGEGGLVWVKNRDQADNHYLFGSDSNWASSLTSNSTGYYGGAGGIFDGVSSTGFTVKSDFGGVNTNGEDYASWTFRKAPKFFDVVTYTGDGVAGREIAHNLGTTVGTIIVKKTDSALGWAVYHKDTGNTKILLLNDSGTGFTNAAYWDNTSPTDTNFTVGASSYVNGTGATYVAYLFAHNDGDGEFGPDADQDIIKCGSYTGNGSTDGPEIDLGFEPQWILTKRTDSTGYWTLVDAMRGMVVGGDDKLLYPNTSDAEQQSTRFVPSATGFQVNSTNSYVNASGGEYIYIAIRRGPLAPPKSGTEVFDVSDGSAGASGNAGRYRPGFTVDMGLERDVTGNDNWEAVTRMLQGTSLRPNGTNAEDTGVGGAKFDYMDGWNSGTAWADSYSWMWRRAPGFFDVVAYTGTGNLTQTKPHSLSVVPEMIWAKRRDNIAQWGVYHKDIGFSNALVLDSSLGQQSASAYWKATPTDTEFYVGTGLGTSGGTYIAYLFASLDNISKVGSYTGNGSSQNIDCGFTSGARFVLIKRTDNSGSWWVFDTARGIVSGNDQALQLNNTSAELSADWIDPYSSGFKVASSFSEINASGGEYIFYAVA